MAADENKEQKQEELSILFPSNPLTLAGEKMNIKPFPFGKWAEVILKAAGIVSIVLEAIEKHGDAVLDVSLDKNDFRISPEAYGLAFKLISDGGNNLYDILAISARKSREWIDTLEGEDGLNLLLVTFLVNKDFFTSRVAPLFPKKAKETELPTDLPGEK